MKKIQLCKTSTIALLFVASVSEFKQDFRFCFQSKPKRFAHVSAAKDFLSGYEASYEPERQSFSIGIQTMDDVTGFSLNNERVHFTSQFTFSIRNILNKTILKKFSAISIISVFTLDYGRQIVIVQANLA